MALLSFLSTTKESVNESHMRNLILMAKSDNSIDESEVEVIINIGLERGFTQKQIKDMIRNNHDPQIIKPEGDREMFEQLYDLTLVMCADGIIEDDEMEFITNFANEIGFRKTSSAFIVVSILEGMDNNLSVDEIFTKTRVYMRNKLE